MTICPCTLIRKLFTMPFAALAILAASLGALVMASLFQKIYGADPCALCIMERIPYAISAVFAAAALFMRKNKTLVKIVMSLCALAFLINAGIAAYHSGIERHWWEATSSCDVGPIDKDNMSVADLMTTAISECDVINFTILGLTLANLNVFACLGLAVLAFVGGFGLVREKDSDEQGTCSCCG